MQFLWKYVDELVGKGLSFWFLVEMVFYYAVTIIPLAVPITVLISSVMVYGNMAEKYEISSFKSAGVSLLRVMRPGIILAIFTFAFSLLASNYLKPKSNLKFFQAFENVRKQKPSMTIEEGIFNDDFRGFSIRVDKKDPDDIGIRDVMIYDNTDRSALNLTTAEKGKMYTINNGKYFVMELENVKQYREMIESNQRNKSNPSTFLRGEFETWKKIFDMSEFEFSEKTSGLARRKYDLYNTLQLIDGIDSIDNELVKIDIRGKHDFGALELIEIDSSEYKEVIANEEKTETALERLARLEGGYEMDKGMQYLGDTSSADDQDTTRQLDKLNEKLKQVGTVVRERKLEKDIIVKKPPKRYREIVLQESPFVDTIPLDSVSTIAQIIPSNTTSALVFRALNLAQTVNERIKASSNENRIKNTNKRRYVLRLHQMYSWATICIIFMFIGAPLGSIVRKGGYGYPLLIAISFFMLFIVLMIMGEKLNKGESISAIMAAWLPCIALFPVSVILSYLALGDIGGFNFNWFTNLIARLKKDK